MMLRRHKEKLKELEAKRVAKKKVKKVAKKNVGDE